MVEALGTGSNSEPSRQGEHNLTGFLNKRDFYGLNTQDIRLKVT
jgi:hypothetical protein